MGAKICQSLDDLMRHPGWIIARCQCGRVVAFSILSLRDLFQQRGWSRVWANVAPRLRCDPAIGGCGRRGPRTSFSDGWSPPLRGRLSVRLEAPRGIDPVEWARSDDRARKLMVRRVRG